MRIDTIYSINNKLKGVTKMSENNIKHHTCECGEGLFRIVQIGDKLYVVCANCDTEFDDNLFLYAIN